MNLLKTHEVFLIGLATTTAVKNKKKAQHNEKHNDKKQHKKLKKKQITKQLFIKTGMYHTVTLTLSVVEK